jgi:hypothetical protein
MARNLDSPRHDALRLFLIEKRKKAGLRQVDLAKLLKRRQDYVSYVETGHKLVEVVELRPVWAIRVGLARSFDLSGLPSNNGHRQPGPIGPVCAHKRKCAAIRSPRRRVQAAVGERRARWP